MSGKTRPSLIKKTLENVKRCNLSQTDKDCIQAVFEKQIPKKPKYIEGDYDMPLCPNCGMSVDENEELHCSTCGQALDWSDTE